MNTERLTALARNLIATFGLCVLSAVSLSSAADDFSYAPPGMLVDIGKFRLHFYCDGQGSPTVVVDMGLGESAIEWMALQQRLRHYSRTCLYDRAGYGWSDFGGLPRSSSRIVDELYIGLKNGGIPGPYLLVGHSFGGLNMQLFARRYPYLVAGLVLVDSSTPEQIGRVQKRFLEFMDSIQPDYEGGISTADFVAKPIVPAELPADGPALRALMMMSRAHSQRTVANEYINFKASARQVLRNAGRLPDVPTVVLSHGLPQHSEAVDWNNASEEAWDELQTALALAVPRAAHIVAERSGHQIHLDQPELVVDAVAIVLDFARAEADGRQVVPTAARIGALTWLPFDGGRWQFDRLHTMTDTCPFGCDDRRASTLLRYAGHLAGTRNPAWQRVPHKARLASAADTVAMAAGAQADSSEAATPAPAE